jgi:predicted metal-dependent hydrolase
MSIESHEITVNGLPVHVVRKPIKNLHLGVYPPNGRVRIAAPLALSDDAVRLAVVGKLGWIKRQRARFEDQPRQSKREMVSGESHYFLGRRYRLRVVNHDAPAKVMVRNRSIIELYVRKHTSAEHRERILHDWYRRKLKDLIPPLLEKWTPRLGVQVDDWAIKRMKTKWGTCNVDAGRIWLNLELAKKPVQCLEYIIVHELTHLLERKHTDRFVALMDKHLPQWRAVRQQLNSEPLSHANWSY